MSSQAYSQCDSAIISGNLYIGSDTILSGAYNVSGSFTIPAGVTITVESNSSGNCGNLKIYADKIFIETLDNEDGETLTEHGS